MPYPQELNSSVFPALTHNTVTLAFVCLGVGAVLLGQKAVFEYLKSCAVLCLNVVCGHCAVRLSPCLSAGYTEVCYLYVVVIKDRLLFN